MKFESNIKMNIDDDDVFIELNNKKVKLTPQLNRLGIGGSSSTNKETTDSKLDRIFTDSFSISLDNSDENSKDSGLSSMSGDSFNNMVLAKMPIDFSEMYKVSSILKYIDRKE